MCVVSRHCGCPRSRLSPTMLATSSLDNAWLNIVNYYPTLLRRVQITRETNTNITRYLYSSHSPDRAKHQKPWQVRILEKQKRWIINLLLDILVCSIAVNFYSSFVF